MNKAQRCLYLLDLWPAACHAQGWDPKDERMRRDVTLTITGERSSSRLSEPEITRLFDYLKHAADPLDLDKAIPAVNPDVAEEADRCRQLRYVIEQELMPAQEELPRSPALPRGRPARPAFADAYVQQCAIGWCRAAKVEHWYQLPSTLLTNLRNTLVQRRRDKSTDYQPRLEPYHRRTGAKTKKAAAREPQVVPRPGATLDSDLLPF